MRDVTATISFALTPESFHRLSQEHRTASPRWRARQRTLHRRFLRHLVASLILTGVGIAIIAATAYGIIAASGALVVGAVALAACWWVWTWTLWPGRQPSGSAGLLNDLLAEGSPSLGNYVITVSPLGVEVRQPILAAHYKWPAIVEINETPAAITFEHILGRAIIVPRSAFVDSKALTGFLETARSLHAASGFDPPGRIRDYLQTNEARCTQCRQALRGCTERTCPGCRHVLDFLAVPDAMRHLPRPERSQASALAR